MIVKLKKDIIKEYGFAPSGAGDFNTTVCIAIDMATLKPVKYRDMIHKNLNVHVFSIDAEDINEEFKVVDHINPMPQYKYDLFKELFEEISSEQDLH
jgi:hypothetical protein